MKKLVAAAVVAAFAAPASAATGGLLGEWYNAPAGQIANLSDAKSFITGTPDATFTATALDYAGSNPNFTIGSLSQFLGSNATGLSGMGGANIQESVFVLSGFIHLDAGDRTFRVTSDDGFELNIGGGAAEGSFSGLRAPNNFTDVAFNAPMTGSYAFDLIYFEGNVSAARLKVELDGVVVDDTITAPVPVPAALPLLASALGVAGWIGRRRRA